MEKELIGLCEKEDEAKITQVLSSVPFMELEKLIDGRISKGRGDPTPLIKAILFGSKADSVKGLERRIQVFKYCIKILQNNDIHTKVVANLVGYLLLEVDSLPPRCLADLASVYVEAIKTYCSNNGKYLELFPKILSSLELVEVVPYQGSELKGSEYKGHVLNSLCSTRWDNKSVIHLAAIFRDISLSPGELKFVLEKIIRMFPDLDFEELPPLVFQLLLLSTKGHRQLVLDGIISFFNTEEEKNKGKEVNVESMDLWETDNSMEQIRQTEGTIILHITFAAKQDQEITKEFLKSLKASQQSCVNKILSPFSLALILSLGRFDEQLFEFLKTTVLKCYKEREKYNDSWWVREMYPDKMDVAKTVLETVKNSTFGWDHVTQGLVQLGFLLMDAFGPKLAFGKTVEKPPPDALTPVNHACDLGAKVLQETFKLHEMVRPEILEQILNRVVIPSTPVRHYLELLSAMVLQAPLIFLESLPRIRETLNNLAFLPVATAEGLLHALQPLMKISMGLKDSLIILLRKSLFSRQLESRKIAVTGYLLLLKHFKVLGGLPCSQVTSQSLSSSQIEVHGAYNAATNEGFCLEILTNLRRCLSQQADIRLMLYEGLYEVLYRNSQLSLPILDMLHAQLMKFYEKGEDVQPPLKLDPCIVAQGDQIYIAEPLGMLVNGIQLCLRRSQESLEEEDLGSYQEVLESLTRRMIKSEMEDFELDKSADFSRGTGVGLKNNIFAILVLGIYEALMEYNLMTGKMSSGAYEDVIGLFKNYKKLCDVLREKAGDAAGKKGRSSASSKVPQSLLSLRSVTDTLGEVFNDFSETIHPSNSKLLRENTEFVKYLLTVANQKLQQLSSQGHCQGAEGHDKEKIFKYTSQLAKVFLNQYSTICSGGEENKQKKKLGSVFLEGLTLAFKTACSYYIQRIEEFLKSLGLHAGDGDTEDLSDDLFHKYIKLFQRLVITTVTGDDDDKNTKEGLSLLGIISMLSKHLQATGTQYAQIHNWLGKICMEHQIDDVNICKLLISQLLTMTTQMRSAMSLVRDISLDIHCQLGDVDQNVEVEDDSKFAIITHRTSAPTVLLLVLSQIERDLEDTDWAISKMRGKLMINSTPAADEVPTQREGQEKSVCTRLGTLITAFHELVQCAMPTGNCSESMLKSLTHFYTVSTNLCKYYQFMYSKSLGHFSARFEKLVKLSGTHLTQCAYAFVTYIQASAQELYQQQMEKKGKKGEKRKNADVGQAGKSRLIKEARSIPNLVFSIEQYEKFLIQLSKKSKINLMEHMKHSTSRDFRINTNTLQEALQDQATSESEEEQEDDVSGDENNNPQPETSPPPAKKKRLGGPKRAAITEK
ncbi:Fanconi anemia group I protein-like [Lineus longissimus]|uniref:Fanconi anemia group I protein-like n=1 Tax=Lineus longissimus TaxID=88925 RepID=UPI00315CD891